jgi:transposase
MTISRDRHRPYADGVRRGAPQVTQVADRFHLVRNLRGAVQQELNRDTGSSPVEARARKIGKGWGPGSLKRVVG